MKVSQEKENHIFITLNNREYVTVYANGKNIRLLIEYKNGELKVMHFRTKE